MSRELRPLPRGSQVWPASRLTYRLSISTPVHTVEASWGSATSVVTRLYMIRGHSWAKRTGGSDQVLPPSAERNNRGGQVPTRITSGCFGRIAIDQICMPLAGDSTRDQ